MKSKNNAITIIALLLITIFIFSSCSTANNENEKIEESTTISSVTNTVEEPTTVEKVNENIPTTTVKEEKNSQQTQTQKNTETKNEVVEKNTVPNKQTTADTEKHVIAEHEHAKPTTTKPNKNNSIQTTKPVETTTVPTAPKKWGKKGDLDPATFEKEMNAYASTFDNVVIDTTLGPKSSSWTFNESASCYKSKEDFTKGIKEIIYFEIDRSVKDGNTKAGDPIYMNVKVELQYDEAYEDYFYTCYVLYLD